MTSLDLMPYLNRVEMAINNTRIYWLGRLDAEDIRSEAILGVLQDAHDFDLLLGSAGAFVYCKAKFAIMDHIRKEMRRANREKRLRMKLYPYWETRKGNKRTIARRKRKIEPISVIHKYMWCWTYDKEKTICQP